METCFFFPPEPINLVPKIKGKAWSLTDFRRPGGQKVKCITWQM